MQVLIDYLTLTSKIHDVQFFIDLLGLSDCIFMLGKPYNGWYYCMYYDGVKLLYGGRDDVCLDMSGKGCRTVEHVSELSFDWLGFFRTLEPDLKSKDVHIARLDVACDDFEGVLSYPNLVRHTRDWKYICKSRVRIWIDGDEQALYYGSKKSDRRLRIYNKALEQGYDDDVHWMRVEFQFRDDCALSFVLNWFQIGHIGRCYQGVLVDYIRFVTEPVTHENYSRAVTTRWWQRFTGNAFKVGQLYLQGRQYSLASVEEFVRRQASSSLKTLLIANGGDLSALVEMIEKTRLNKRQEMLLSGVEL